MGQGSSEQENTLRAGQAGPAGQPWDLGELPSLAGYAGERVAAVRKPGVPLSVTHFYLQNVKVIDLPPPSGFGLPSHAVREVTAVAVVVLIAHRLSFP